MTEREIFSNALQKPTAAERADYLDQVCGSNSSMRDRIEKLLAKQSGLGSFMEHPPVEDYLTELAEGRGAVPLTLADQDQTSIEPGNLRLDFLVPSEKPGCLGILGQYEILEVVGRGGMGIVLKGHDTKLNRIVAIKILSPEIASIPTAHKRFLREAQAAAAVSHDHIVTIYAVEEQPVPHLVMEYIDGCSLQEKIDAEGQLELKEVLRIGRQIAAGLAAAHEQGLTHRDIKPSNILLRNGIQRVQITDFGLARATADIDITRTGEITGTPQYMSPEQAKSWPIDHRSDLFSLGAVLYAMCSGRSPFRADTPLAAIKRVCDDEPRPLRENNPEIPEWMEAIIGKLLSKAPDDRFQSAKEVADLLSRHLAHLQDPGATQFPGTIQVTRSAKRRPVARRWMTAAAVLLITLVGLGFAEATGVTNLSATVIRIATGEGTLVIEVDDPTVQISLDGEELSITGAGLQELRLRPGQYQFRAVKDGESVKTELVSISHGQRQIVRVTMQPSGNTRPPAQSNDWEPLFDGTSLNGWRVNAEDKFSQHGDVRVRGGEIILPTGKNLTGITWTGDFPLDDYEVLVEAKRTSGKMDFASMTFPVGNSYCCLQVNRGLPTSRVGFSAVDGLICDKNATGREMDFETGRWYQVVLRVAIPRIEVWIDDQKVTELFATAHRLTPHGGLEPQIPFGVWSFGSTAIIRQIRLRRIERGEGGQHARAQAVGNFEPGIAVTDPPEAEASSQTEKADESSSTARDDDAPPVEDLTEEQPTTEDP